MKSSIKCLKKIERTEGNLMVQKRGDEVVQKALEATI
jgi:hypothetical protein